MEKLLECHTILSNALLTASQRGLLTIQPLTRSEELEITPPTIPGLLLQRQSAKGTSNVQLLLDLRGLGGSNIIARTDDRAIYRNKHRLNN